MKPWNFESLEIRKLAIELTKQLSEIFYNKSFKNYSFQDQIMRASILISNNIAEWNERWYNKEFIKFLSIAKWSCWEVRNMIILAKEFNYLNEQQEKHFINKAITLSVKIYNLIEYLKKK